MFSFMLIIAAIGLLGVFLYAGTGYISAEGVSSLGQATQVHHGFVRMSGAYLTYTELYRRRPSVILDFTRVIQQEPRLPEGFSWGYDRDAAWLCVSGPYSSEGKAILRRAQNLLPEQMTLLGGQCGQSELDENAQTLALTYRMQL